MTKPLIGMQIVIRENEFEDSELHATISDINQDEQKILLKLNEPLIKKSTTYQYVVASPRLLKDKIDLLKTNKSLGCSLTWVPDEKYNMNSPMDLSWWRGGGVAIADLYWECPIQPSKPTMPLT